MADKGLCLSSSVFLVGESEPEVWYSLFEESDLISGVSGEGI